MKKVLTALGLVFAVGTALAQNTYPPLVATTTFAGLGNTANNGTIKYCQDCSAANPCTAGGAGAFAHRVNGAWQCTASGGGGGGGLLDGTLCEDANGFLVRSSSGTCVVREFTNSDGYFIITNPAGTAGDVSLDFDDTNIIPFSSGTADPPATCTSPALYHETDQFDLFFCETTNQWTLLVSNTSVTDDGTLVSNGTTYQRKTLPNGPLTYATASNAFSQDAGLISHATDCTAVTTGIANDVCIELDSERFFTCQPSAGGCDTAGEWILTPASGSFDGGVVTTRTTFGSALDAANAIDFIETAGQITFEGSGADGNETRIAVSDPSADRTITFPNATGTIALLGSGAQTWSGIQTFGATLELSQDNNFNFGDGVAGTGGGITLRTGAAPDRTYLTSGTTSNSWGIVEYADRTFDFANGPCGAATCTNPQFIVHDKDQNTTDYTAVGVAGLAGGFRTTLTESSAVSAFTLGVASGAATGGTFHYCVFASDATDHQSRCSFIRFSAVNKAGTETCGMSNNAGTADASISETEDGNAAAISSGTLTYAITCDTSGTNTIAIQINPVSSLTQTTLQVRGMVNVTGPGEVLP